MARQVYLDPFGERTTGFHAGQQDEMALQDNIRRARAQDFDYNNIKPLELQEARRLADFNRFADQYQRRGLGINERNAQANLFNNEFGAYGIAGDVTGNYNPVVGLAQQYAGLPQLPATEQQQLGAQDRVNRDWLYRVAAFNAEQQQNLYNQQRQAQRDQFEYQNFGAITPADIFRAQAYGQYGRYGGGTPAYNPIDFGTSGYDPTGMGPGGPQGPQAAPYQFPGLSFPGQNAPVPGIGVPLPQQQMPQAQPTYVPPQPQTGSPYPPGWMPATGENAVNMFPTNPDGTPMPYGSNEWSQYMGQFGAPSPVEAAQPEGEPLADAQGRPTDLSWAV